MRAHKLKPLFQHAEFQAEFSISKELPYWDFISDIDPPCAVLSDGTLVQGMRLTGVSPETWDSDQVNQFTRSLRSVLNSLPDGGDVQFFVDVNSDFSSLVDAHEKLKSENELVSWVADGRIAALRARINSQSLQRTNLYLFVYLRVKSVRGAVLSFFASPKKFEQIRRDEFLTRARELAQTCVSIEGGLKTIGVDAGVLSVEMLRSLIYRNLNPVRSQSEPCPAEENSHRNQEFTPEELKREPRLSFPSPREQLAFSDLIQGTESFFLDGYYHRILTLKTLPEVTQAALISRLTALPFHYTMSIQLQCPDQSKELSTLQSKRRMAHSMNANNNGRVSDLESEAKLSSTEELLRELINTGQKIFYFQLAILIRDESRASLDLKSKTVLSRLREMNGAEGISETVAGFKVFKTILPGGNTTMVRPKRAKTDNLADFIPVYQPWEGEGSAVCLLQNRAAGLMAYDPFDPSLPNYNALVTGSSGAGKSFLNNCLLLQYLSQDPLVYVIDIGGSYRKLCEFMSGQYIEISPPQAGISPQAINPFLLPIGATEPSPQKIKFLIALLETVLTDEEGEKLPKLDKSLIEEAVMKTYSSCPPGQTPRLSDLRRIFEESPEPSLKNYAKMLYPWTGDRPYGRLLDAENALSLSSDMVVFDLKSLSSYPDLQSVMILIITDFILGKVENEPNRKKRILMDECWDLLRSQGASQFMEYCARTLRKTGSGITFITQALDDIERSAVGPAILNNTATKIILTQRGDLERTCKTLKLNDQEIALIHSLKQQKGVYSEAFLIVNDKRTVIRVVPTPVEYWLATSDAADNALLSNFRTKHPEMDLPGAIHALAEKFPSGSHGVTVLPDDVPEIRGALK